jgi:hypothetical protein
MIKSAFFSSSTVDLRVLRAICSVTLISILTGVDRPLALVGDRDVLVERMERMDESLVVAVLKLARGFDGDLDGENVPSPALLGSLSGIGGDPGRRKLTSLILADLLHSPAQTLRALPPRGVSEVVLLPPRVVSLAITRFKPKIAEYWLTPPRQSRLSRCRPQQETVEVDAPHGQEFSRLDSVTETVRERSVQNVHAVHDINAFKISSRALQLVRLLLIG